MKIIFFYEELAIYFQRCIEALQFEYAVEIHLFRKSINQAAPFNFEFNNIHIYNESDFSLAELEQFVDTQQPDLIYCAGWINKKYLAVVKKNYRNITTVLGFDNSYNGSIRQRIALLYARYKLTPLFRYVFVPGEQQKQFAQRMGFSSEQIYTGAYSCDYDFFSACFKSNQEKKTDSFPRRFIYVGRYHEVKGIENLWTVFEEISKEYEHDWELWCFGTGHIAPRAHNKIKHFGFVQPEQMKPFIAETGVFILPSLFEPWGVVVHEFAAAGFPLILSDKVGAAESFLTPGENGHLFDSRSPVELKKCILSIMDTPTLKLNQMAEKSAELAGKNTPKFWAKKLYEMIKR